MKSAAYGMSNIAYPEKNVYCSYSHSWLVCNSSVMGLVATQMLEVPKVRTIDLQYKLCERNTQVSCVCC